ncbi:MAG: cyclic nucleotide-binding domain-containing protein [Pseudomonadota bacterium]|nr:cyclic nucleotide-binding domain-containing protein [Pseudomonadota bacterium]
MSFAEFLNTVPAFEGFSPEDLLVLDRTMVVQDFPDGHVFIQEGKYADAMYLVVRGEVVVTRRRPGRLDSEVLNRLGPGDVFGLVGLIDHGPRSASCRAAGPVQAACLPYGAFELLFKGNTHIRYRFQRLIARQLVHDIRSATALLLDNIDQQPG